MRLTTQVFISWRKCSRWIRFLHVLEEIAALHYEFKAFSIWNCYRNHRKRRKVRLRKADRFEHEKCKAKTIKRLREFALREKYQRKCVIYFEQRRQEKALADCFSQWNKRIFAMQQERYAFNFYRLGVLARLLERWKEEIQLRRQFRVDCELADSIYVKRFSKRVFYNWIESVKHARAFDEMLRVVATILDQIRVRRQFLTWRDTMRYEIQTRNRMADTFRNTMTVLKSHGMFLHWNGFTNRWRDYRKLMLIGTLRNCLTQWIIYMQRKKQSNEGMILAQLFFCSTAETRSISCWKKHVQLNRVERQVQEAYESRLREKTWNCWVLSYEKTQASHQLRYIVREFRRRKLLSWIVRHWSSHHRLHKASIDYVRSLSLFPQYSDYNPRAFCHTLQFGKICRRARCFRNWRIHHRIEQFKRKKKIPVFIAWKHHFLTFKYTELERECQQYQASGSKVLRNWKKHSVRTPTHAKRWI